MLSAMEIDEAFMRRAIALARENLGRTGDNPAVGCLIVKDGVILGQGATGAAGRPHAEEAALATARGAALGATAYLTLEPCGERSAGGLSCSELLIAAGVARVLVACADFSVYAKGRGVERLLAAETYVALGFLANEAALLYANYLPAKPLQTRC